MKHRFRTLGRWLALVGIAGASTVGLAPQAGAYAPGGAVPTLDVVNCTAAAAGSVAPDPIDVPTVTFGTTNQSAGCWALQADPGEAWQNGDQVLITVNDAGGGGTPGGVFFSSKPTVKLGDQTVPDANVTLLAGNTQLRVVVTGLSAPTFADMVISNVKYDVDFKGAPSNTAYGPVSVTATVNGTAATLGPLTALYGGGGGNAANAFVSDVSVAANDPEVGLDINTAGTAEPISDITIREASTSALPANAAQSICINTGAFGFNPDTVDFTAANVTKTAGDATAVGIAVTANQLRLTFTTPATRTAANTFKVTGITVDPGQIGRILVNAVLDGNNDCATPGGTDTPLTPATGITAGAVIDQDRTGGSDRFQTARRIAEDWFGSADAAIIARGDDFADALAASGLAGKVADDIGDDVPILLTNTNSIPSATLNALTNLGTKTVYIVGGTQAVSQGVEDQLRNKPAPGSGVFCPGSSTTECLRVVRIAGPDRYGTAQEIANFMGAAGTVDLDESDGLTQDVPTAFLARGDVFADALAVGPLAYDGADATGDGDAMPILLTPSNTLSPAAAAALIDLGVQQVVIAGGTSAVSDAVKSAVEAMGIKVVRVGGTNRQHTAALIAGMALGASFGFSSGPFTGEFILARGDTFPDALAAGPLGGDNEAPILLTENPTTLGVFTTGIMDLTSALVMPNLHLVGQTAAVSDAAATAARAALSGTTL